MSLPQEEAVEHDMPAWPMPLATILIGGLALVLWLQSGGYGMENVWGAWGILGIMAALLLIPVISIFLVGYTITYFVLLILKHRQKRRLGMM